MPTDKELLRFATELAREAGAIMRTYFYQADRSDVRQKDNETPVTTADMHINQLVIDKLRASYPEHGLLAEEQSYAAEREQLWVCDPIDSTNALINGVPVATFSLAYVVGGQPRVGVILDPFQDRLFTAVSHGGAFCNDQPIHVSTRTGLRGALIGGSGSYAQLKPRQPVYDYLAEQNARPLLVPGNIFKSALVAGGHMDGYMFPGRSAHDVAAAAVIVSEAGGRVTDLDGKEQRYDGPIRGAIISNGHIHDELVQAVAVLGSEQFLGY